MGKTTGVINSTNMVSTYRGGGRSYDVVADVEIENAMIGYLDGLVDGEDAVYNFKPGVAAGKKLVIVDQPAWDYDECRRTNQRKDKFKIDVGTKFRVRKLYMGDEFEINPAAVTEDSVGDLKVDAFLTVDTSGKLIAKASTTASAQFEATVSYKKIQGGTLVTNAHTYGYSIELYKVEVTTLA